METIKKEVEKNGKKYLASISMFEYQSLKLFQDKKKENKYWLDFVLRDEHKNVIFEVTELTCKGTPDIDKGINLALDFLEHGFEGEAKEKTKERQKNE